MDLIGATNHRGKQREADSFCWSCHRDEPTMFCSTCPRAFHISPACSHSKMLLAEEMQRWQCSECTRMKDDEKLLRQKKVDAACVKNLLKHIFKLLKDDEYLANHFMTIEYPPKGTGKIVRPINLEEIGEKVSAGTYNCLQAFWSDISWVAHNTKVHLSGQPDLNTATEYLLDFTKNEVHSARLCHECYINAIRHPQNWFTMVCKQPHLLVWAKLNGWAHWPAKLMAVDPAKNTVDVFFFCDDHSRAVLTPKDCFIYSRKNPSVDIPGEDVDKLVNDKKEAEIYIRNLTAKFDRVNIGEENVPLNSRRLERHLYDLIPGAWKLLGKTEIPSPIPQLTAPAKIRQRRNTVSHFTTPAEPTAAEILASGRIITRRLSTLLESSPAFDEPMVLNNDTLKDSEIEVNHVNSPSKKRKSISGPNATEVSPNKIAKCGSVVINRAVSPSASLNETPFKVPAVPKPPRSIQMPSSTSCKLDDRIIANVRAINEMVSPNETSIASNKSKSNENVVNKEPKTYSRLSKSTLGSNCANGAKVNYNIPSKKLGVANETLVAEKNDEPSAQSVPESMNLNDHEPINAETPEMKATDRNKSEPNAKKMPEQSQSKRNANDTESIQSLEFVAICDAIVKKNAENMAECIESSLFNTLTDFLNATKPTEKIRMLKMQMGQQKVEYETLIDIARQQICDTETKLKSATDECDTLNIQLKNSLERENMFRLDLQNARAKIAVLEESLSKKSVEMAEMKVELVSHKGQVQDMVRHNHQLMDQKCKLSTAFDKLLVDSKNTTNRAREEWAKLMADTKLHSWCASCKKKGRYYCNTQCEANFWKQSHP